MKILVISMAGIGDTILSTQLIHELRLSYPNARVDALVLWAGSKYVLEGNPHWNQIHQRNLLKQTKLESLGYILTLRRIGYNLSINTHPESRRHYRLAARIIGAPVRLSNNIAQELDDVLAIGFHSFFDFLNFHVYLAMEYLSLRCKRAGMSLAKVFATGKECF